MSLSLFSRPTPPRDRLAREHVGRLAATIFADHDSGGVIARLHDGVVVKGRVSEIKELEFGRTYRWLGAWHEHAKHGDQFHFDTYLELEPAGRRGVIRYLTKLCDGIGEGRAESLYDAFGGEAVATLRTDPDRAARESGIPEDVAREAAKALAKVREFEQTKIELFNLFAGRGFPGDDLIRACVDRWAGRATEIINRNPFSMLVAHLPGCGFKRCDRLWLDLGKSMTRLKRQMLCGWHAISSDGSGHTWFPMGDVLRVIRDNVAGQARPERAIRLGLRAGWFRHRRDQAGRLWVCEAEKGRAEQRLADAVANLIHRSGPVLWPDLSGDQSLSPHQREKLAAATAAAFGLLTGTPGTGKTYTAAAVVRAVIEQWGADEVAAVAPTGKAAVRLTQSLKRQNVRGVRATTIHRLLGLGVASFKKRQGAVHNEHNPIPKRFVFVDELSMLDTTLGAALFAACGDGTHVLAVGDPYQLPPVGHGAPLRDLIAAGVPNGELTEIRRNAGMIVHACAAIKDGKRFETAAGYDGDAGKNLVMFERATAAETHDTLRRLLERFRVNNSFHPVWQTQVIVAVNEKGELSRKGLNAELQRTLNPTGRALPGHPFRVGDKIICLKNGWLHQLELTLPLTEGELPPEDAAAYQAARDDQGHPAEQYVANGELGRVLAIGNGVTVARFSEQDEIVRIPMGKKKAAEADVEDGDDGKLSEKASGLDFDLGYAVSGHKMQGSEAPCCVVVVDDAAGRVCSREWWYTSLSRASKLCAVIGSRALLERQAKRLSLSRRKTFLKELLAANLEAASQAAGVAP